MNQVGIDPNINKWNEPVALGVVDPHDSLSHPAGVSDAQAESASCLEPDQYTNFVVSALSGGTFRGWNIINGLCISYVILIFQ